MSIEPSDPTCVFCSIVAGERPSRTVYEDREVMAFLDINPLAPGHTLVIPKAHHERLDDLDAGLGRSLLSVLHRLTSKIEFAVDADGSNVGFNNGPAAGQEIPHVHGHIIPRFEGDGGGPIHRVAGERPRLDESELDEIAESIRDVTSG